VHVGRDDASLAEARAALGPAAIVGVSCYDDLGRAAEAAASGASYVAFGSFFASPTKPGARRASPSLLADARHLAVPKVAIGGLTPDNAPALVAAGADLLAVSSAIFDAPDPRAAARAFAALYQRTPT
jgi:thiamine-phosphate pyrophosphorylase